MVSITMDVGKSVRVLVLYRLVACGSVSDHILITRMPWQLTRRK